MEEQAHRVYDNILKEVEGIVGNKTTYSGDLNKVCKRMFGKDFVGVYASDEIPKMTTGQMAILNLDKLSQAGSHWIAVVKGNKDTDLAAGQVIVYDSFGRKSKKIINSVFSSGNGRIIDADYDSEQDINETNCGARCIAFLLMYKIWGRKMSLLV